MGEPKTGEEFITHEYDEAIAVQQCIVDAETTLSTKHPVPVAKRAIKAALREDKDFLAQLKALGKPHGATGKIEDVAEGLTSLMNETLETATSEGADSDFYEAHAVLLNIKRKQMDSAGGMLEIARATKDTELRDGVDCVRQGTEGELPDPRRRARRLCRHDRDCGVTDQTVPPDRPDEPGRDPGASIGNEPELESETIPGGVTPQDERVSAYQSRPGLAEEPTDDSWSEGQSDVSDVTQEPVEYDPLPRVTGEPATDDVGDETPILGGSSPKKDRMGASAPIEPGTRPGCGRGVRVSRL